MIAEKMDNDAMRTYTGVLAELAGDYPLLCLDPDRDAQDVYRRVVLRGGVLQ